MRRPILEDLETAPLGTTTVPTLEASVNRLEGGTQGRQVLGNGLQGLNTPEKNRWVNKRTVATHEKNPRITAHVRQGSALRTPPAS